MRALQNPRRLAPIALFAALLTGIALPACSGDDGTSGASITDPAGSGGAGGGGAGGEGGAGGAPSGEVCVSSPKAAPLPGNDGCPSPEPDVPDAFDDALAVGGLTRCDVRLPPEQIALSGWSEAMRIDKRRLPDFTPLQLGPLRLPGYARETAAWLDAAAASKAPVSETIAALSVRRGHVLEETCLDLTAYEGAEGDTTPLATAVLLLNQHHGGAGDEAALRAAAAGVPLELQAKLARVVGAIDFAAAEVKAALGTDTLSQIRYFARSHALFVPAVVSYSLTADKIASLDTVDLNRMTAAAALLARAIEAADFASSPDALFAPFAADTPIGRILVHDASDDLYPDGDIAEDAALLFDLGGSDTYEVPAGASSEDLPVSIAIDVRGEDRYGYKEIPDPLDGDLLPSDEKGRYSSALPPDQDYGPITLSRIGRQGAGLAGIGMLLDLGPEGDTYRSLAISQGFAAMGVGILYDAAGDDDYAAEAGAQGAGVFGIAALIDAAGSDVRRSFHLSQGFGGTQAAAAIVDLAGDDEYLLDSGDPATGGHPLYYSPQLPGSGNTSMSQGAAQGRRPSSVDDAAYMAGGVGILRDTAGVDRYEASVFAQGAGYWQGLGLFLEGGSEGDTYNGAWYIQGATAHFALALFLEEGGDDKYNPDVSVAATSIGVGHDFSASLHIDEGGDDAYNAPGLSLGSGNVNGIGCFVNAGGADSYEVAGDPTFGAGNYSAELPYGEPRQNAPTIGIFVDVGGADTYEVAGSPRMLNNAAWSYEPQPYPIPQMVTTEHGCGTDSASGLLSLP